MQRNEWNIAHVSMNVRAGVRRCAQDQAPTGSISIRFAHNMVADARRIVPDCSAARRVPGEWVNARPQLRWI